MSNNSVSLHRVLKATPEKVYRAFTEANAIASWLPPYGFLCTVHEMNAKAGGTYKMSFQIFQLATVIHLVENIWRLNPMSF